MVFQADLYGGTHHFVTAELARFGVRYSFVSSSSPADIAVALEENTRVVYLESPSNPLLKIIDLEETAALLRGRGVLTMIDNTFATPMNQTPLGHGLRCLHPQRDQVPERPQRSQLRRNSRK